VNGRDEQIELRAQETIGDRLRRRRRQLGLTQSQLAERSGLNQGYLSSIERSRAKPSRRALDALAAALAVPSGVLAGGGDTHDNPQPLETRRLPLLGSIPAGPPALSQELLELMPVLRHHWAPDHYCLRLTLDSMEPTLKPGDIVLVHYRPDVQPEHVQGRICACLLDGEPTLKRVTVESLDSEMLIILRGDNPRVAPLLVDSSHLLSIQGVVTHLVSRDL
jgi:SOS-response transcriptional repressor LexA